MEQNTYDINKVESYKEDNRLEAKAAQGGVPKSMWETYSSFANTEGGIILLGVEEKKDHQLVVEGVDDPHKLISQIWDLVNNRQKVNVNILTERMVHAERVDGKDIVVVEVPRAELSLRPVYLNQNPEGGTYRRNFEGDYHCDKEQVSAMYRDSSRVSVDQKVLSNLDMSVFCKTTIKDYRDRFRAFHDNHIWNDFDNEQFLRNIGATALSDEDQKFHPTLAGLIMFGYEYEIVRVLPQYFLDYREVFDPQVRWTHRLTSSSGDWSGNIYDFFWRVYPRLRQNLPVPFAVKDGVSRIDEPHSYLAIRELLLNSLAHGDYYGRRGFVIINSLNDITIANPGDMRVSLKVALEGGVSDPRNVAIMRMFGLVGIGDRAGSGMTDAVATMRDDVKAGVNYDVDLNPARTTLKIHFGQALTVHPENSNSVDKIGDKSATNQQIGDKSAIKANSGDKSAINNSIGDKSAINDNEQSGKEESILSFLKDRDNAKSSEISEHIGLGLSRTKDYLKVLTEKGLIVAHGSNKNRPYSIKSPDE